MDVLGQITSGNPKNVVKKKGLFRWLILILFFSALFLLFYLMDQNIAPKHNTNSNNNDTISEPAASIELPSSKKEQKDAVNASQKTSIKQDMKKQIMMDSIRLLSTQIRDKLKDVERALDGGIEEVDKLQYKKITYELQNLRKQFNQNNQANTQRRFYHYNRLIHSNQEVLTKLDSLETVINKANKLTKLNDI